MQLFKAIVFFDAKSFPKSCSTILLCPRTLWSAMAGQETIKTQLFNIANAVHRILVVLNSALCMTFVQS